MSDKYFAKVVKTVPPYLIVINKGINHGVNIGDMFIIVELGDDVIDPDTSEVLERLEIVKGTVRVEHVQDKIATLKSCQWEKKPDKKEIKKVFEKSKGIFAAVSGLHDGFGETVTESISPGESYLLKLDNVSIGDLVIKI